MISERFHLRIKDEFLHRNGNSRLDGFADLLIKCVEDLSDSIEIKERRRMVSCSFRMQETHKCHRLAKEIYKDKDDMINEAGEGIWTVLSKDRTKTYEVIKDGSCYCHQIQNTHCISCGVCAYAWRCTCLDNRSGISCIHRHAVMTFAYKAIGPEVQSLEESVSRRSDDANPTEGNEASVHCSELGGTSVNPEQEHREARYQTLHAIKSTYAVVEAAATSLAKSNTEEAKTKLEEILAHLQLAAGVVEPYSSTALAPRPEMAKIGGKPQIAKIQLHRRKKKRQPKEAASDLHKEVQQMAGRVTRDK